MILTADIGGTNARLDLFDPRESAFAAGMGRSYETAAHDGALSLIRTYLAEVGGEPTSASLAVAAPVRAGRFRLTNLDWWFEPRELSRGLGLPVRLLNDFEAVGYAVPRLVPADLHVLQEGTAEPAAVRALIGAGTGLGTAYLTDAGDAMRVRTSEGGHTSFAPRDEPEDRLLAWLRARDPYVPAERVLSGPGLLLVYRFLRDDGFAPEGPDVRDALERAGDEAPNVISRLALEGSDRLCVRSLEMFTSALGARARDLALTTWATGGVYLAGGIAPAIVEALGTGPFLSAFHGSGPMRDVLERVPVRVIRDTRAGLLGAAVAPAAAGLTATGGAVVQ
jgi:glucokinase